MVHGSCCVIRDKTSVNLFFPGSKTSVAPSEWKHIIIIIIIGIQPLGRSGQRPELSQATGMALVRCILGKFLRFVCHCFPPIYIYIYYITPVISVMKNAEDDFTTFTKI